MSEIKLITFPEDVLRKQCVRIQEVTDTETAFLHTMWEAMKYYQGIGLAASQVGVLKQMFVADIGEGPLMIMNPEIVKTKGADVMEEGCLSVPNMSVLVERPSEITVVGLNQKGEKIELTADGLLAKVIQHEMDHLHGKLIIDYLPMAEKMKYCVKHTLRKHTL